MPRLSNPADAQKQLALLLIVRYPKWAIFFGLLSMALFRLPLWLNRKVSFWRLMGSGRNGTFDIIPDLQQWAILVVLPADAAGEIDEEESLNKLIKNLLGSFINKYILIFKGQSHALLLSPEEGHGQWNGRAVFGSLERNGPGWQGPIGILTRATIRITKAHRFWKYVEEVARQMATSPGFVTSYGIGEAPFIKQATFSVWENREAMTAFAYRMPRHKEVIRKTYAEKWYSEDMFVRFRLLKAWNHPQLEALLRQQEISVP